jgi:hypothetical protein
MRPQAGLELPLPLGVLDLKGVQRGKQSFVFIFAVRRPRPTPNIFVGRRLMTVLKFRDF